MQHSRALDQTKQFENKNVRVQKLRIKLDLDLSEIRLANRQFRIVLQQSGIYISSWHEAASSLPEIRSSIL